MAIQFLMNIDFFEYELYFFELERKLSLYNTP